MIRFDPRLWICSATRAWAPAPMPTIAMTAATPMMMPSIVRALRSLFTRRARPRYGRSATGSRRVLFLGRQLGEGGHGIAGSTARSSPRSLPSRKVRLRLA